MSRKPFFTRSFFDGILCVVLYVLVGLSATCLVVGCLLILIATWTTFARLVGWLP